MKTLTTLIFAADLFLGVISQSHCQTAAPEPIRMQTVPLTTVIEVLAQRMETNYILDAKILSNADGTTSEPVLTFLWTNLTFSEALSRLLKEQGLKIVQEAATPIAFIVRTNETINHVDASLLGNGVETNVPIVLQDVPLDKALHTFIRLAKVDVALDSKISSYVDAKGQTNLAPDVSVRWQNVTAKQAIVALCEAYDLVIRKDPATGTISIKPKD